MSNIYSEILSAKRKGHKLLAILLDPDKVDMENVDAIALSASESPATHIFIGGSHVTSQRVDELVRTLKISCALPVVLFPGNPSQISKNADGILFLSLLSGRNAEYLIGHHVNAAPILRESSLEIIPTGYILIESGNETAVARVSRTEPLTLQDPQHIVNTAMAGEMLGSKLIYLEGGSGAQNPVPKNIIRMVSENIEVPLIVGGGIRSRDGIDAAYGAGADIVVIGTAFEEDLKFFESY